jgi:hypothetical protein
MAAESVDVIARTYHTENDVAHLEGETYTVTDRALAETLRGIGFVGLVAVNEAPPELPPVPVLASLVPATGVIGAAPFTLQILGSGFLPTDTVQVNGAAVASVFMSATELNTSVDLTAISVPGDVPVIVNTADARPSNALTFTVTAAA